LTLSYHTLARSTASAWIVVFHYNMASIAVVRIENIAFKIMGSDEPASAFLITRLTPPPLGQGFVLRPRLRARLDQAALYALTLVTGPAGSGKSTLLADWAREEPNPVAWFSVETEENDPVRFWRYFTAALQTAVPTLKFPIPISLPQLGPGVLPGSLDQLCNALDVHHQQEHATIHRSCSFRWQSARNPHALRRHVAYSQRAAYGSPGPGGPGEVF
jgi:hypothetical protein